MLQPVLYALAAEKMLGAAAESGRLFYCTQRGGYREYTIEIDDKSRGAFGRAMAMIDEAIASGFLPAAPSEDACSLCEFAVVCGPHEAVRVRRWKDPEGLVKLNELRCIP